MIGGRSAVATTVRGGRAAAASGSYSRRTCGESSGTRGSTRGTPLRNGEWATCEMPRKRIGGLTSGGRRWSPAASGVVPAASGRGTGFFSTTWGRVRSGVKRSKLMRMISRDYGTNIASSTGLTSCSVVVCTTVYTRHTVVGGQARAQI
jgi:hypothetical protein